MLRDSGGNGGEARQAARNVLGEPRNLFDKTYDGVLSGWLLRHGAIGCWESHGLRGDDCDFSKSRGNDLSTSAPALGFPD
jgi:hypothetical protein